ncbi:DUF7110 family protein [Salarchaeum japonicum]|uniref:DUF7110 family protein n=1 Tax=Salarchaeum japonicum TaxID=555573 RepID=UPI003C791CCC
MTGHVYQLSANFDLPLEDLEDYLDNPDLPAEVEDLEIDRRNRMLFIKAVAADDSLSKYTPTAQLKAKVEEKRIYDQDEEERQWARRNDEEDEITSELVEYASFSGDLETVLQNTAVRYPMFVLLRNIALLDVEGTLTAITADEEEEELQATRVVDGEARRAAVEVVEQSQANGNGNGNGGVDWRGNEYIN